MYAMITLPLAVDPFAVIILGGVGLLLLALILIGHFYPGSGADQVHWRSTRSYDQQVMNEIDDLDQMLEATNARRRRRGEPELTEGGLHARVREDMTTPTSAASPTSPSRISTSCWRRRTSGARARAYRRSRSRSTRPSLSRAEWPGSSS